MPVLMPLLLHAFAIILEISLSPHKRVHQFLFFSKRLLELLGYRGIRNGGGRIGDICLGQAVALNRVGGRVLYLMYFAGIPGR